MDEDEVIEFVQLGTGDVTRIPIGLQMAEARARSRFVSGEIDADEFERELERLVAKGHRL